MAVCLGEAHDDDDDNKTFLAWIEPDLFMGLPSCIFPPRSFEITLNEENVDDPRQDEKL